MNRVASLLLLSAAVQLGGCARVAVRPEGELPKPLIVATPAKVGVVVTAEAANYTHKESRASVDYEADLGPSHRHLVEEIFKAEFTRGEDVRQRRCPLASSPGCWRSSNRASNSSPSPAPRRPAASTAR